jgi:hypothetical protein
VNKARKENQDLLELMVSKDQKAILLRTLISHQSSLQHLQVHKVLQGQMDNKVLREILDKTVPMVVMVLMVSRHTK